MTQNSVNLFLFHFRFYSGELEVARAKNVILYTTLSNKSQERELNGLCGLLVMTNFKLSFLTQDNEQVCGLIAIINRLFSICIFRCVCALDVHCLYIDRFLCRISRTKRIFSFNVTMSPCKTLTESIR